MSKMFLQLVLAVLVVSVASCGGLPPDEGQIFALFFNFISPPLSFCDVGSGCCLISGGGSVGLVILFSPVLYRGLLFGECGLV